MTTLTEYVAQAQQEVNEAQAALDAANQKLQAAQQALDAVQPHIGVLQELEAKAAGWGEAIEAEVKQAVARMRSFLNL